MKLHLSLLAGLLLAGNTLGPNAWGQKVYKCGTAYSQLPCPGAVTVDAGDSRTPAQKAQTDDAAARAARSAEKLEQDRLALERAPAGKAPAKPVETSQPGNRESPRVAAKANAKQKKKAPEFFTAAVPQEKKKVKKIGNKSAVKAPTGTSSQPVKVVKSVKADSE